MTALPGTVEAVEALAEITGIARITKELIALVKRRGDSAAQAMLRVIVTDFGEDLVRGTLDQMKAAESIGEVALETKFGSP